MQTDDNQRDNQRNEEQAGHYLVPLKTYFFVWGTLLLGTVLTVVTSYFDLGGSNNILAAMAIATFKALLVILFFMGLRWDGQENNATFFTGFVFLAVFVGLTSADIFYRADPSPVKVDATELAKSAEPVDVAKLVKPEPASIEKGKNLYAAQCVACHGATGQGDGPAAAALNPKPRNFKATEGWKNGTKLSAVFKTLTEGIPGSPMPPFGALPAADRFAIAHYVQTLMPSPPSITPEDVAALEQAVGGAVAKPRLSVDRALQKVAEEYDAGKPRQ